MRGSPCVVVAGFIFLAVCYWSWFASWLRCQGCLWGLLGGGWGVGRVLLHMVMYGGNSCGLVNTFMKVLTCGFCDLLGLFLVVRVNNISMNT